MRGRAASILGIETTGFILKKNKLVCTPPQEIDREWERDGISKNAPAGQGERAFWTERVLAAVPPSYWQHQLGLEPSALIAAVADDPFGSSVVAGWAEGAIAFAAADNESADWLGALASRGPRRQGPPGTRQDECDRAYAALAVAHAPRLRRGTGRGPVGTGIGMGRCRGVPFRAGGSREPWSVQFSRAFLVNVRRRCETSPIRRP